MFDPAKPDEDLIRVTGYDAAGNVITQTDPSALPPVAGQAGRITRTFYDKLNRPISTSVNYSPTLGQNYNGEYNLVTQYAYDEVGSTILVTDTLNRVTRNDYDALGRVVSTTVNYSPSLGVNHLNQYNLTTFYAYDKAGNRVVVTDPLTNTTRTAYDDLNRVITTTDMLSGTSVTVYDAVGNRIQSIDALGHTTVYTYDAASRLVASSTDAGQTTRYAYDALGNTRVVTDANDNPTRYAYDALNRVITTTDALTGATVFGYDALSRRVVITDANTHATWTAYDGVGRPVTTTDALGNFTVVGYDALGNRVKMTDELGHTTVYTYDLVNRLVAQADPLSNVTRYKYDSLGNRIVMTDANGVVTQYGYDALNRLAVVTESVTSTPGLDPNTYNLVTRYDYDAIGNRTVITNARGYTTTYTYDALYRVISMRDPLSNTTRYGYDAAGNRTVMTDANNAVITYTYDAVNRLTRTSYPNASVTYAYDKPGNRLVMTDSLGVTRYTYDPLNRLTHVVDPFSQPPTVAIGGQPVTYTYDAVGNRTGLVYPDGKVVTYTFDAANRLTAVTDWSSQATTYAYDKANRLITTTLPNGIRSVYAYDDANRLLRLTHTRYGGSQIVGDYQFTLDKLGNRTAVTEVLATAVNTDTIFADGFESGNFSAWSAAVTDGGDLAVSLASAQVGTYGMRALIDDTIDIYLRDDTPNAEPRYRARFYFDPHSVSIPDTALHELLEGRNASVDVFRVRIRNSGGSYQIRAQIRNDAGTYSNTSWYTISDASHFIEIDWQASTAAGANNGYISLWIDDVLKQTVSAVDNDTLRIDQARLGPTNIASGTSGTERFDAFESRTTTYIGAGGGAGGFLPQFSSLPATTAGAVVLAVTGYRTPGLSAPFHTRFTQDLITSTLTPEPPLTPAPEPSLTPAGEPTSLPEVTAISEQLSPDPTAPTLVASPTPAVTNTDTLTNTNWLSEAQGAIRRAEYNITWQEPTYLPDLPAAYQAPNRAHNLRTYFTPTGIRIISRSDTNPGWQWGLSLTSYGYAIDTRPVTGAELSATDNRMEYRRSNPNQDGFGLTEWYVNDERGLEQGFTIAAPPESGSPDQRGEGLILELALSGNLIPMPVDGGSAVEFVTPRGARVLRYSDLHAYDAQNKDLPARMELTPLGVRLIVDDSAAVYPIRIDPLVTSPIWTVDGDQDNAHFAFSVATAGDFDRDGYADIIIGAPDYDTGYPDAGRVYLFFGSASGPSTYPDWWLDGDQTGAQLGYAVGTAGDVNGDGYADMLMGAPGYDYSDTDSGVIHVFYGCAERWPWSCQLPTTASGYFSGEHFGWSVSTAGDVDDDGYAEVIIGAPDSGDNGAVTIYYGSQWGMDTGRYWFQPGGEVPLQNNMKYGWSVGTAGDVNDDGYADIIIGAPYYDNINADKGLFYVFYGSASGVGWAGYFREEGDGQDNAHFGWSVGTAGDVNGDGYNDVVISAPDYDSGSADTGRVYFYHGSSTGLNYYGSQIIDGDQSGSRFGAAVGTAGDVNGDDYADVIIGAPSYDSLGTDEGRASVYLGSESGFIFPEWMAEGDQDNAHFGGSVSTAGDVNGDGHPDVIIGAPDYDGSNTNGGRAYLYRALAVPIAGFSASPRTGPVSLIVTFVNTTTNATSYQWDFDDGSTSTLANPVHIYTQTGVYTVSLLATGPEGSDTIVQPNYITVTAASAVRVINYTYDPLYRLTRASYENGMTFAYAYDAVGNRTVQTRTITSLEVTTYTYDAANRLVNAGGMLYTWDDNGNLLNDGSRVYAYDFANRLISTTLSGVNTQFGYNGDGVRLRLVAAGTLTTYTQDYAAPLPVVLQAKTGTVATQYVYSLGTRPVAEYEAAAWEYLLPDPLGSVRQIANNSANVTLLKSYEPYGSVLISQGGTASIFGYSGEQVDNTGLIYLRARYMQPGLGIFLSRDLWNGDVMRPGSMNGFNYVEGNPINLNDPTGAQSGINGALLFLGCLNIHTFTPGFLGGILPESTTAKEAVARCKAAYSNVNWDLSFYDFRLGQELPTRAHDLFGWYLFEWRGKFNSDRLFFDAKQPLTQELAKNGQIFWVREWYYHGGSIDIAGLYKFGAPDFGLSLFESLETAGERSLSIGAFMGSFYYQVKTLSNDRIGFRIDNETGLASGTHIADRFEGYFESVERLIEKDRSLENKPLQELIRDTDRYKLISILENKTRAETGGQGGATLYQTYYWTEKRDCSIWWRWFGDKEADMQVWEWSDFTSKTTDPLGWPAR